MKGYFLFLDPNTRIQRFVENKFGYAQAYNSYSEAALEVFKLIKSKKCIRFTILIDWETHKESLIDTTKQLIN